MPKKKSGPKLSQGPKPTEDTTKPAELSDAERMAEWRRKRLERGAVGSAKKNERLGLK